MHFKSDSRNLIESALARSNSTLYLRCDRSGQVVVCSPAMGSLFQLNAPKLVGENFFGLLSPEETSLLRQALEKPEWESSICQISLPRKADLIFQLSADEEGFVLLGEQPDLQALEAAYKRRQLEDSEHLKSAFIANLNHEIRDPLNAVAGMAHLLNSTPLDEQQFQYLKNLQGGIENLREVLDRVLEFSAADESEVRLRPRSFKLESLLQGLSGQLAARARAKEVELLVQADPDVPDQLQGDPVVLHQLLLGLLDNGVKFSAGGRVSLSVQRLETGGLQFKVLDSGIGMSAEQLRLYNDAFANWPTEQMSLRRCRRQAERLGAGLKLESQPGQGTLVTISLPLEDARVSISSLRRVGGPGRKVLVVEDDPLNQRIVQELLAQAGVEVEVAGDGRQALNMLHSGEWRMVLMDLEMPQLDGLETTRRIRQQPKFDAIPIVATTSHVLPEQKQRCREVGMDGFLSKPIDPGAWLERLAEWLPLRPGLAAAFAGRPAPDRRRPGPGTDSGGAAGTPAGRLDGRKPGPGPGRSGEINSPVAGRPGGRVGQRAGVAGQLPSPGRPADSTGTAGQSV